MEKHVKIYYSGPANEIRRVLLRADTTQQLFEKVCEAVNKIGGDNGQTTYTMHYKDEENDLISLSTPQEFEVCIASPTSRDILRIFASKKSSASGISVGNSHAPKIISVAAAIPTIWKNVTCDNCQKHGIEGTRYKCTVCPDYDECSKCVGDSARKHVHEMVAMHAPGAGEWRSYWQKRGMRPPFYAGEGMTCPRRRGYCGGNSAAPRTFERAESNKYADWMRTFQQQMQQQSTDAGASAPFPGLNADAVAQYAATAANWLENLAKNQQQQTEGNGSCSSAAATSTGCSVSQDESGYPEVKVDFNMKDLLKEPGQVFSTVMRAVEEAGKIFQSMAVPQPPTAAASAETQQQPAVPEETTPEQQSAEKGVKKEDPTAPPANDDGDVVLVEVATATADPPVPLLSKESTAPVGWTLLSSSTKVQEDKDAKDMIAACLASLKDLGWDTTKPWMQELVKMCQGNLSAVVNELTPGANNMRF